MKRTIKKIFTGEKNGYPASTIPLTASRSQGFFPLLPVGSSSIQNPCSITSDGYPGKVEMLLALNNGDLDRMHSLLIVSPELRNAPLDKNGNTALILAVIQKKPMSVINFLIENNADPEKDNKHGQSALSIARAYALGDVLEAMRIHRPSPDLVC